MKTLWRLALVAAVVAFLAALMGSWTRINGAGLTCPDWPLCHGKLIPSFADGTIWEWSHRFLVFLVSPLVLAVIIVGWRFRTVTPIRLSLCAIGALFVVQVLLGAATVYLSNNPISVVLHWGTAMAFVAVLVTLAIFARSEGTEFADSSQTPRKQSSLIGLLAGTMLVTFVTMCVGAYVSSSGAGLACLSLPGCVGNIVVYSDGQYVQMLHRFMAAASLLCAAAAFALGLVWRASARVRVALSFGVLFIFVQIVLGLLNVAFRLPIDLREAHAANAVFVFLSFVVATVFALLDTVRFRRMVAG
ncbi:MAG: COX15/CtaA family protein [Candidatus Eremiobacteraeota bacterium]|nr:COX15/CtaA family protein [Candidatus Eremiobacteraeota bacterium]